MRCQLLPDTYIEFHGRCTSRLHGPPLLFLPVPSCFLELERWFLPLLTWLLVLASWLWSPAAAMWQPLWSQGYLHRHNGKGRRYKATMHIRRWRTARNCCRFRHCFCQVWPRNGRRGSNLLSPSVPLWFLATAVWLWLPVLRLWLLRSW